MFSSDKNTKSFLRVLKLIGAFIHLAKVIHIVNSKKIKGIFSDEINVHSIKTTDRFVRYLAQG